MKLVLQLSLTAASLLVCPLWASSQNVGIGTNTPLQKLHVEGNTFIKDSVSIGIDSAKATLDVKGAVLFRGGNSNMPASPIAAIEFFTGRGSAGGKPPGLLQSDIAFNYGGSGGGYRHFITSRHANSANSAGNAIDFYINNANTINGSSAPGTGNLKQMSVTATGIGIGTDIPTAKLHLAGNQKIDSTYTLEFGAGMTGKENNAGKIGYQSFSSDALDIVGAGSNGLSRKVKFWAEGGVETNGELTVAGKVNMGYNTFYVEYTAAGNTIYVSSMACPAGQRIITGGGGHRDITTAAQYIIANYSGPDTTNPETAWMMIIHNSGALPAVIRLYCTCARIN